MTATRRRVDPERVRAIFDQAADLPRAEQAAYVAETCGGDEALAREVRELLTFDASDMTPPTKPALERAEEAIPGTIGRFEVVGKLGQGGMGVVFAGRDRTLGREVAIKLVRSEASQSGRARLLREAQAMARLAHPNVVPIYEAGLHGEGIFFAMELVRGATLSAWLRAEERSWRDVLAKFVEAGRGLYAAHEAGILHRDFKPENVLVGEDGRARVLDFGLARAVGARAAGDRQDGASSGADEEALGIALTRQGTLVGTPAFMSPEHFDGTLTAASDQWSFAVALYRGLFGAAPFGGETILELRETVLEGTPRTPAVGDVPVAVVDAVARGMARQPEDRFPSLGEMVHVLEHAIRRDPELDRETSRRQRRWLATLVALLGFANVSVLGIRTHFRYDYDLHEALRGGILGMGFIALGALLFRRALSRTKHNRRVVLLLFLAMATMTAHRLVMLGADVPLPLVLRTDAIIGVAFYAVGWVLLEPWFAMALVVMASYVGLTFALPAATLPAFPVALVGSVALGIWFWREPGPAWNLGGRGTGSTTRGSSPSDRSSPRP